MFHHLSAILNILKCSMMRRWHHSDSPSERYQEEKTIKIFYAAHKPNPWLTTGLSRPRGISCIYEIMISSVYRPSLWVRFVLGPKRVGSDSSWVRKGFGPSRPRYLGPSRLGSSWVRVV